MPRSALDRLAGPILVFLGVSTIASTALLVPIVTSRRAGEGVQRDKPGDNAVNDGTTMAHLRGLSAEADGSAQERLGQAATGVGASPASPVVNSRYPSA
eukprot:contig_11124_g2664